MSEKRIKVSVIIPAYNCEQTITRCIESVLCQTLREIEVIVINDGSTDKTEYKLKSYNDKRIKVITTPNRGQGLARNEGMNIAQGEYIGFVDADDTICSDMYESMYNAAVFHNAEIVQCAFNDIQNGKMTVRPNAEDIFVEIGDKRKYIDKYFFHSLHTSELCNKIFKRSFIEKNNLKLADTKEIYSEDLKFNIDILPYMRNICYIKKPLYNYIISENGHCRKDPEKKARDVYTLYKTSIEKIGDFHIRNCIKSMAVTNLIGYCVPIIDTKTAAWLISNKTIKGYMFMSIIYQKRILHTALMLSLICSPKNIKKKIIKWKYVLKDK